MKRFALWAVLALCAGGADRVLAGFIPGDIFAKNFNTDIYNVTVGGNYSAAPKLASFSMSDLGKPAFSADLTTMYVSNSTAGVVNAISSSGVVSVLASGLSYPEGILRTSAGHLLVVEAGTGEVTDITGGGNFTGVAPFASGLTGPTDLAQLPDGQLFVTELGSGEVSNITAGGAIGPGQMIAAGFATLGSIVASPSGGLKVADINGGVWSVTASGTKTLFASGGPRIFGLAYASDGRLLGGADTAAIYDISAGGSVSSAPIFASGLGGPAAGIGVVPEPSSLAAVFFLAAAFRHRRLPY